MPGKKRAASTSAKYGAMSGEGRKVKGLPESTILPEGIMLELDKKRIT
jgi:hypothetical protein